MMRVNHFYEVYILYRLYGLSKKQSTSRNKSKKNECKHLQLCDLFNIMKWSDQLESI